MNAPRSRAATALPLARLLGHAADAVQAVLAGQSLNDALARTPAEARGGTQALSFHALRWLGSARAVRARLAPKSPPPAVDALLLTALALLWPAGTPPYDDHTLVDQAVDAMRRRSKPAAPFVNAVLRRFLREREALVDAVQGDPVARWNHPRWWIARLHADWPHSAEALLAANNTRAPMTLRVNARRADAPAYLARLHEAGIAATRLGHHAIVLGAPVPVTQLPGFADGDVSVQDASAQRAAPLLLDGLAAVVGTAGGRPRVLDACAAPGGKTAHLLELADLDVLAIDRDADRLARVRDTLSRLGLEASLLAADAADTAAWWDGQPFDAILLDAPCTASGIVRRHPDVRWLRRESDVAALAETQARLLNALWPTLRRGGVLLYATCSVFRAEGEDQIDVFLQRQGDASVVHSPSSPGHLLPLPDNGAAEPEAGAPPPGDGFFLALLHKT